jgi:glyoxylase-like metal-dependent hydrolase (beta-lactamase superfamily II)
MITRAGSGAVSRVRALSTGSVRIRPEHAASNGTPELWWLMTSRRWTEPLPINVYVIEHRDGLVLFDAGQDRASVLDPDYFPKALRGIYGRLAQFDISEEETLPLLMERAGYSIRDVRKVVISHLHQDHVGALADLAHAELYVSAAEWRTLRAPFPEFAGVLRNHIDLPGLRWRQVDLDSSPDSLEPFASAHDLMGDGSLVLVPTPGHTPGSMSLLVRDGDATPLLLCGDLTYSCDLFHDGIVPGVGNTAQLRQTTKLVTDFERMTGKLDILAAHDPTAAARLAATEFGRGIARIGSVQI